MAYNSWMIVEGMGVRFDLTPVEVPVVNGKYTSMLHVGFSVEVYQETDERTSARILSVAQSDGQRRITTFYGPLEEAMPFLAEAVGYLEDALKRSEESMALED
jgi:hydrogenase maturation factor